MVKATRVTNTIRAQRFAHGEMTQAELARRIGVSRQTVIAIEQGRYSPSLEMAFQIARVFGVPLDSVFQYSAPTSGSTDNEETADESHRPGRVRTARRPAPRRDRTARPRAGRGPPAGAGGGLDQGVWHLMTGMPYALRAAGFGLRAPRQRIRGLDVAGRVEAVGPGVGRLRPGDEVYGTCTGSFAEYACAKEDELAPRPAWLTPEQAAVVTVSATTALQALRTGRLKPGLRVLVIGASGGVGTYAVQLAKALGAAHITAVCSAPKADLVRSSAPTGPWTTPARTPPTGSTATTSSSTSPATVPSTGCAER